MMVPQYKIRNFRLGEGGLAVSVAYSGAAGEG